MSDNETKRQLLYINPLYTSQTLKTQMKKRLMFPKIKTIWYKVFQLNWICWKKLGENPIWKEYSVRWYTELHLPNSISNSKMSEAYIRGLDL